MNAVTRQETVASRYCVRKVPMLAGVHVECLLRFEAALNHKCGLRIL
jgi:hypothetical protein